MLKRKNLRLILTVLFGIVFIISTFIAFHILQTDKLDRELNPSGFMTLALVALFIVAGNVAILIIRNYRKN